MATKKPNVHLRYAVIAGSFAVICIVFIVVLAVTQIRGPQTDYMKDDQNTKTVTVAGLRGEIYDRNGKLLVGNSTSYDLLYEYGAMPNNFDDINACLLEILDAVKQTSNEHTLAENFFPLEGVYPNFRYKAATLDQSSNEYYYLARVIERHGLSTRITAEELSEFYIDRCHLSDELYSDGEIRSLMCLWYEMDRIDFGVYQSYTIAKNVPIELVTLIEEKGIEGVTFKTVSERVYNYPGIASHILGRIGKIAADNAEYYNSLGYPMDAFVGISGCELAFEAILHGQDGKMVIRYDDDGNIIEKYYQTEPISGNDVYLTIDIDLQIAAEQGLKEGVELTETEGGGAITAVDVNTGAVLAIASYPTYDLTLFSDTDYYASLSNDSRTPLFNRALSGTYAPGSTYKIGVALAALETGAIDDPEAYTVTCNKVYPHLHRPTCLDTHGTTDIFLAIQESCNIFFYTLGHNMGIDSITAYTSRLGLGADTGIELPEKTGIVAGPAYRTENKLEPWSEGGDDVSAAIGQSDHGYTPLQLSVYMASIANKGTRYTTHILDSVRHFYTDDAISVYQPTVADSVNISESTYNVLIESMRRVVYENNEVSKYFGNVSVTVGGKTGTAQVTGKDDYALFSGFAPLDNPQIAVSCIIEEGKHGYYASSAVAKVMEEFFRKG